MVMMQWEGLDNDKMYGSLIHGFRLMCTVKIKQSSERSVNLVWLKAVLKECYEFLCGIRGCVWWCVLWVN